MYNLSRVEIHIVFFVCVFRLELRTKELEASLELEQTARARLEAQAARARDSASASAQSLAAAQQRDIAAGDDLRKAMRTVRYN